MPSDPNCIFCKIIAGQIPCAKVYEDEMVLAFLDIGPLVRGHTLVIPKSHHATVMDIPPETLAAVATRLPKITKAVLSATGAPACHVLTNNGSEAMQSVHHLHFHILPRGTGEAFRMPWPSGKLDSGEAKTLAGAITSAIKS
ncbi:MAG TPA: HIT family protein [Phycisphaerae bacterium]|jgi:histidine triad (HIT) family protein|nr:HIT family protein [Phycisphaerae bacterium]